MEYKKIFLLGIFKAFSTCSKTQFLKTKVFLNSILNGAQPCWKHMQRVSSESYIYDWCHGLHRALLFHSRLDTIWTRLWECGLLRI